MSLPWHTFKIGDLNLQEPKQHFSNNADILPSQPKKPSDVIKGQLIFDFIVGILSTIPIIIYALIKGLFSKPKSIKGKICLVTGAGRGLGRDLCVKLANLGAEVVCVDIREDINNETVKLIKENGGKAHGYTCNVAKYQEVMDLAVRVQKEVGRVYLLVNNAALIMVHKAGEWPPEEVVSIFNVNVISHYWTILAFLPAMKDVNEGHIVSILSVSALNGTPGFSVYGATKAAGKNLLNTLSMELNANNENRIKITGIYPSVFNSSVDHSSFVEAKIGFLDMNTVVEKTIEAILKEKTCVSIPNSLYYWIQLTKFLPDVITRGIYDIINMHVRIPNNQYKANIPFNSIMKECIEPRTIQ